MLLASRHNVGAESRNFQLYLFRSQERGKGDKQRLVPLSARLLKSLVSQTTAGWAASSLIW
ncbi:MAG: hypothetical protein R3C05_25990 [Pirellulaceae bacterium]